MGEEDNHTKDLLNKSNFKIWKQQIYLLLKGKNLIDYIYSEKLKKVFVRGQGVSKRQVSANTRER